VTRSARPPLALTYHGIADVPLRQDPQHLFVRPEDLVRQITRLRKWGYDLVTFGELATRVGQGSAGGAAALTFDDGLADNLHVLVPVLQRLSAPATVFVVSGWLGRPHPRASWAPILNADEVRTLHAHGIEIGAHSVTHPDLSGLSYPDALAELTESKRALEALIDGEVDVAAYPYGNATAETRRAAQVAGYRAACRTSGEGSWTDPYDLPRQAMENRASLTGLRLKREGRYERLMRIRAARGVRRLSRRVREAIGR
jgi:peptidoglycan/xylan/chitin deacetylase (PgdA/CDA1 family)